MKKQHVTEIAHRMAGEIGLVNISLAGLSEAAGISPGSFPHIVGCKFSEFIEELAADVPLGRVHASTKRRANPALRRQQILQAAVAVAADVGYNRVTRNEIAEAANVADGLVSHYLGDMATIRNAILCEAVRVENLPVIAQGVLHKSPLMDQVEPRLKRRAMRHAVAD